MRSLSWSASKDLCSSKQKDDESKRIWKIIPSRYCKYKNNCPMNRSRGTTKWLTIWTTYIISEWVIVRYRVRSYKRKISGVNLNEIIYSFYY